METEYYFGNTSVLDPLDSNYRNPEAQERKYAAPSRIGRLCVVSTVEPEVTAHRGIDEAEHVMHMHYMERFDYMVDFYIETAQREINNLFQIANSRLQTLQHRVGTQG